MVYFNSWAVETSVNNTDVIITPANMAIPPRFGVEWRWEVRPLGWAMSPSSLAILTIPGMDEKVIRKVIVKAIPINRKGAVTNI